MTREAVQTSRVGRRFTLSYLYGTPGATFSPNGETRRALRLTRVKYDLSIVPSRGRTKGALVPYGHRVHGLGVPHDLAGRRARVVLEDVAEPVGRRRVGKQIREGGKAHFSRPSPTAMIRLLSPSHARSLLRQG